MVTKGASSRSGPQAETDARIAGWIRFEMQARRIASIRQLARMLAVSHGYLARVVSRRQRPGLDLLVRLTRTLHLDADRLLNEDPPDQVPIAAERGTHPRPRPGGPPSVARQIDPDLWLARAREARKLVRKRITDAEVQRSKAEGRP
ncbi:MAG TPA: hypothetical protein VLU43_13190 [Anaeromyxobacteraceae bacterium]|nr:hypothetical protein [Anaeromyxobacteraceae bacterium]